MLITFSHRLAAVFAGAAITAGAQLVASQTGARADQPANPPIVARHAVAQPVTGVTDQAATVRYWTTARMAAALKKTTGLKKTTVKSPGHGRRLVKHPAGKSPARPAPAGPWLTGDTNGHGLRWTHGGTVAGAVGKVFFSLGGADYVCSGTLVGSAGIVLTAGHCVADGRGPTGRPEWAKNWMFVPGYHGYAAPYGEYTARRFFVSPGWSGSAGGSEAHDVAFVQVAAGTPGTAPPPGLPVKFAASQRPASQHGAPASRAYVFGYPSLAPYTGRYPNYCAGPVTASGGSLRMSCGMTAGDSGGPWVAGFSPGSGNGEVVAVSTYKVSTDLSLLYGAVLGPQARALYARAVSSAR